MLCEVIGTHARNLVDFIMEPLGLVLAKLVSHSLAPLNGLGLGVIRPDSRGILFNGGKPISLRGHIGDHNWCWGIRGDIVLVRRRGFDQVLTHLEAFLGLFI